MNALEEVRSSLEKNVPGRMGPNIEKNIPERVDENTEMNAL